MKLRFLHRHHEKADIWSYYFAPLSSLSWVAGQSIRLEIPAGYDTDEKRFTIASAPHEEHIMITTRHSKSVFKKGLAALEPGTEVDGFAIEGEFVWHESPNQVVGVAIGIGITPFRSILLDRLQQKQPLTMRLLYYARPDEMLYEKDWVDLSRQDEQFSLAVTHQHITAETVMKHAPASYIYLSGAEKVVDDLRKELITAHQVDPGYILTDRFSGSFSAHS